MSARKKNKFYFLLPVGRMKIIVVGRRRSFTRCLNFHFFFFSIHIHSSIRLAGSSSSELISRSNRSGWALELNCQFFFICFQIDSWASSPPELSWIIDDDCWVARNFQCHFSLSRSVCAASNRENWEKENFLRSDVSDNGIPQQSSIYESTKSRKEHVGLDWIWNMYGEFSYAMLTKALTSMCGHYWCWNWNRSTFVGELSYNSFKIMTVNGRIVGEVTSHRATKTRYDFLRFLTGKHT